MKCTILIADYHLLLSGSHNRILWQTIGEANNQLLNLHKKSLLIFSLNAAVLN